MLFKHGPLTQSQEHSARLFIDKYPYVILVNKLLDYEWTRVNLSQHNTTGEDCMGNEYIHKSQLWGTFECTAGRLYFFFDKSDYDKVCELSDIVIDRVPFVSVI